MTQWAFERMKIVYMGLRCKDGIVLYTSAIILLAILLLGMTSNYFFFFIEIKKLFFFVDCLF